MKFLLTNDDGYDAIGLRVLAAVAKEFGEVFVVAPRKTQSGCSHQYTFDRPIELVEVTDDCGRRAGGVARKVRNSLIDGRSTD